MAPRIARETKRVWSINVKREEEGVWLLIARGATSTRMDPQRPFGHWSRSHRRTHLPTSLRCQPAKEPAKEPACQRASVPWGGVWTCACGPGWGRDSELHVQINPKQSGLEMPRFGRAADETGQDWTAHHGAPQHKHLVDRLGVLDTTGRGLTSTGHVVVEWTDASGLGLTCLACPPSTALLLSAVLCPLGHAGSGENWPVGLMNCPPGSYGLSG